MLTIEFRRNGLNYLYRQSFHSSKKDQTENKNVVTFIYKINTAMKKFIVALALASGIAVIAYASLSSRGNTKHATEKQEKKDMKKKECQRTCLFS